MATEKKTVMLRYPRDLVKWIDDQIEDGLYLNRTDFCVHRARLLMNELCIYYSESDKSQSPEDRVERYRQSYLHGVLTHNISVERYKEYTGPIVPVSVQFPIQLYKDIVTVCDTLDYFSNVQDFIKTAILHTSIIDVGQNMTCILSNSKEIKASKPSQEWMNAQLKEIYTSMADRLKELKGL